MAGPFWLPGLGRLLSIAMLALSITRSSVRPDAFTDLAVRIVMHVNKPFFVRKVAGHVRLVGPRVWPRRSRVAVNLQADAHTRMHSDVDGNVRCI